MCDKMCAERDESAYNNKHVVEVLVIDFFFLPTIIDALQPCVGEVLASFNPVLVHLTTVGVFVVDIVYLCAGLKDQ